MSQRINAQNDPCVQVESILVDACAPTTTTIIFGIPIQTQLEGDNEMVRFRTGSNALNISDLDVTWPGQYTWAGARTPDDVTAQKTAELNATVQSCGVILEPENGVIPPNSKVLLIASYTPSATTNSFADLVDTLYVVYQNSTGRTGGHVLNAPDPDDQTLIISFGDGCSSTVTYYGSMLLNQNGQPGSEDGATVLFDDEGNATYINSGCVAPVVSLSAAWILPGGVIGLSDGDGLICQNDEPINLNTLVTGTEGGEWTGEGVTDTIFNPAGLEGTYVVTYSVGFGDCVSQETKNIVVNLPANAEWTALDPICISSAEIVALDDLVTGTAGGTFTGQGVQNNIFDPTGLNGAIEITYKVGKGTCEVTNTNTISLVEVSALELTTEQTEYCENEIPYDINANAIETAEVSWYSDEELNNQLDTGSSFTPIQDQSTFYYAVQQLGDCRSDVSSIEIKFNPAPEPLDGVFEYALCPDEEVPNISFETNDSLTWYLDAELIDSIASGNSYQANDETDSLYVVAENEFCKSQPYLITIEKLENVNVSISLEGNDVLCNNEQVSLISSTETGNIWSTNETSQEIVVSETGLYILSFEGPCNISSDSVQIINQSVFADFNPDPNTGNIPFNVSLNNNSSNANQYVWMLNEDSVDPTNGAIQVNDLGTNTITLIASNDFGCNDTTYRTIDANEELVIFEIPNSFTPNGDGFNDVFKVKLSGITSLNCVIYNRWGESIFEWSGAENGWDGTANSRKSPEGVYFYLITAHDFEGKEILKQGNITLKR